MPTALYGFSLAVRWETRIGLRSLLYEFYENLVSSVLNCFLPRASLVSKKLLIFEFGRWALALDRPEAYGPNEVAAVREAADDSASPL